jgi:hypothetical protein
MVRIVQWLGICVFWIATMTACAATSAQPEVAPLYPEARPAQASDAALAAEILAANGREIGAAALAAAQLYRIPDAATYADVKAYYQREMQTLGWQEAPDMAVEGDTLNYYVWTQADSVFVIGVVENVAGDGAYLTTSVYSQ